VNTPRYLNGIIWSGLNAAASVLLPLGIFIFFAHTMSPAQIGVVALSVACTEILKTIGMQGLYEALLQQKDDLKRCHETAAFALLLAGMGLLVIYLIIMHILAVLMPDVAAYPLALDLVGLRIVIDLVSVQPQAALAQRLLYRRLGMRALVANSVAGALGIALALGDKPLTGLIAYQVGQSALVFLTASLGTDALSRPRWHRECFQRMAKEASLSTGVRLVAATINNLDQVVIGPLVGSIPFAYYNLGKRIETTFITTASSFGSILFQPLFARHGDAQPPNSVDRAIAVLTIVCGLPAAVFVINAQIAIATVFGQQWAPATGVAVLLALSGLARAIGTVPGSLLSVSGRNRDLLMVATASAVAGIALVGGLATFGITWCAGALMVKNVLSTGWQARMTRNHAPTPWRTYLLHALVPFVLMTAAALAGRWVAELFITGGETMADLATLTVSGVVSAIACAGYFLFFYGERLLPFAWLLTQPRQRPG
jgi:O-antigen/teichoic acid export membrane protein